MAVMTGGFATVAGGVMAAYVGFLEGVYRHCGSSFIRISHECTGRLSLRQTDDS